MKVETASKVYLLTRMKEKFYRKHCERDCEKKILKEDLERRIVKEIL